MLRVHRYQLEPNNPYRWAPLLDIFVFPQSSGGFWGGVTECGLGSGTCMGNRIPGSINQRGRDTGVGGGPVVNMIVSGQPTDIVLDDDPAAALLDGAALDDTAALTALDDTTMNAPGARPAHATDMTADPAVIPEECPVAPAATAPAKAWDAGEVVTEIYQTQYKSLVRLALLLVHDVPTAEEVVQEAFEAMHTASRRLRDTEKALSYLRQTVVNRARSVLRHRTVVDKNAPKPAPDEPSAEHGALAAIERNEVIAALRALPDRQREALVLRYYADLSEADIAATMGISRGAVKSHTARGMAALRSLLEQEKL